MAAINKQAFIDEIMKSKNKAKELGQSSIDLLSGDIHRTIGGYPGPNHRMPLCCGAMRELMSGKDSILEAPLKGNGATLRIRYYL